MMHLECCISRCRLHSGSGVPRTTLLKLYFACLFALIVLKCLADTGVTMSQEMSILEEVMEEAVYALGDEAFGVLAQVRLHTGSSYDLAATDASMMHSSRLPDHCAHLGQRYVNNCRCRSTLIRRSGARSTSCRPSKMGWR